MLISLTTLLATLSSIFRLRAALELENLARATKSACFRGPKKRPKLTSGDRLLWICLSHLWRDWRSALAIGKPETVVALAIVPACVCSGLEGAARPTRTTVIFPRGPRSDPQDVPGQSRLGCTPHPRGLLKTRIDIGGEQRQQIMVRCHKPPVSDLAHISGESRQTARLHRLLHGAHYPFPGPLRVSGVGP